jgi:hypothetical protein
LFHFAASTPTGTPPASIRSIDLRLNSAVASALAGSPEPSNSFCRRFSAIQ